MKSWRYVKACSSGTAHSLLALPCQDRALSRIIADTDGQEIFLATVADGAGSAQYSEHGAEIATRLIFEKLEDFLKQGGIITQLSKTTVEQWITQISDHIGELANDKDLTSRDYACTLLVAVVKPTEGLFFQIGDGAIVIGSKGDYRSIFWPMTGEYANSTYFITDDSIASKIQFKIIHNESIEDLALMSDGLQGLALQFSTKTVYKPFFEPMFTRLAEEENPGLSKILCCSLERFLNSDSVCNRTDDDKTLVLSTCRLQEHLQTGKEKATESDETL